MANVDTPIGAFAAKHQEGGNIRLSQWKAGAEVFIGAFVAEVSDGDIAEAAANADLMGVSGSYAAANEADLWVYDDPRIIFMCQSSGVVAQIDQNSSADIIAGSGSTVTFRSAHEVSATAGTGLGEQLIILDKVDRPDNDWGANVDLLVIIYEHIRAPKAGTPGGI